MRERTIRRKDRPRQRLRVLAPLRLMEKFLEQARDQSGPVTRTAAGIADRLEFLRQNPARLAHRGLAPFFSKQKFLRFPRPRGCGGDSTESQTRRRDPSVRPRLNGKASGHRADVHLAAFGNLEPVTLAEVSFGRRRDRHHHLEQNLILRHRRLAVGQEKVRQRHRPPSARRSQHNLRIEREQHRRGIADRRGRDQIAAQRGAVADLTRAEHPQHLGPHRKIFGDRIAQLRERHRPADPPRAILFLEPPQLRHRLQRNQRREFLEPLADLQTQLGRPRNQARLRMRGAQLEQFVERIRTEKLLPAARKLRRVRHRLRLCELAAEVILRRFFRRRPRLERRLPDRTIPRAPAKIPAQLVVDLPVTLEVVAVIPLEHRHHDPRRAIAALRPVIGHHALLHGMQLAFGQPLDRDDLPPVQQSHRRQTAVERPPDRPPLRIRIDHRHGARPAIPFGATLLRPRPPRGAQPVEQGDVWRDILQTDRLTIQRKLQGVVHVAEGQN